MIIVVPLSEALDRSLSVIVLAVDVVPAPGAVLEWISARELASRSSPLPGPESRCAGSPWRGSRPVARFDRVVADRLAEQSFSHEHVCVLSTRDDPRSDACGVRELTVLIESHERDGDGHGTFAFSTANSSPSVTPWRVLRRQASRRLSRR